MRIMLLTEMIMDVKRSLLFGDYEKAKEISNQAFEILNVKVSKATSINDWAEIREASFSLQNIWAENRLRLERQLNKEIKNLVANTNLPAKDFQRIARGQELLFYLK